MEIRRGKFLYVTINMPCFPPTAFLIDTGSAVSIIPTSLCKSSNVPFSPSHVNLSSASGQNINVAGELITRVSLPRLRRCYTHSFVIADVTQPILGMDFLSQHTINLDISSSLIIDKQTNLSSPLRSCSISLEQSKITFPSNLQQNITALLERHKNLFMPFSFEETPPHDICHRIETTGEPVYCQPRRLHPSKLAIARAEFEKLLLSGVIRPSSSAWASPLHMVPKSESGSFRLVGDYQALNRQTKPDRYPLPDLQSFNHELYGAKFFSKLDLTKAFHQIPVHPDDVDKTAITTPFGSFAYLKMPFGLRNSSATFTRFINKVLRGVRCFAYIDDILIYGSTQEEHDFNLNAVLQRLGEYGLRLNLDKCLFSVSSVDFLGYNVNSSGISPKTKSKEDLLNLPSPNDYASLRRIVGMFSFYRRFIPNYAKLIHPLQILLNNTQPIRRSSRSNTSPAVFVWTTAHQNTFDSLKSAINNAVTLAHPDPSISHYSITTDASNIAWVRFFMRVRANLPR